MKRNVQTKVDIEIWRRYKLLAIDLNISLKDLLEIVLLSGISSFESGAYSKTLTDKEK